MEEITKKRLNALLKCTHKGEDRPAIQDLQIKDGYLSATDGYRLVRLRLEPGFKNLDALIDRKKVQDWCKDHTTNATISIVKLAQMADENGLTAPDLGRLEPKGEYHHNQTPIKPDVLLDVLGALDPGEPVDIHFREGLDGAVIRNAKGDVGVAMAQANSEFERN